MCETVTEIKNELLRFELTAEGLTPVFLEASSFSASVVHSFGNLRTSYNLIQ